jgi:hypothetical protein
MKIYGFSIVNLPLCYIGSVLELCNMTQVKAPFYRMKFLDDSFISFSFYISFLMMDLITKCLSKIWYFYDGAFVLYMMVPFVSEIQIQIEISGLVQ